MRKPGLCLKTLRQGSHSYACKLVFDKFLNKLKDVAKAKSFGTLSDEELDQPWIGADWRTMSGSHGFSVPFSRKKEGDPYPGVPYHLTLSKGADSNWAGERKDFAWKDAVHSIQALGEARCLRIFYHASYTPAAGDCVAYLPHLRVVPDRVSGVAPRSRTPEPEPAIKLTRAHHARQGGVVTRQHRPAVHHPGAPCLLPPWLVSDLNTRGGYTLNARMPCLQVSLSLLNVSVFKAVNTVGSLGGVICAQFPL